MRRAVRGLPYYAMFTLLLASCDSPTGPLHDDLDAALLAWTELNARDYTFEVASAYSMFPRSGFYRVRVENKQVVEAFDENGARIQPFTLSLDFIWDNILAARTNGEVNSVLFNRLGVPIETDLGNWPLDGGSHYSVRAFVLLR